LDVPLHTVMKITPTPTGAGCVVEFIPLGVASVNTQRSRGVSMRTTICEEKDEEDSVFLKN
jgi:hypothetical protein